MREYFTWVLRYVPDAFRGEFINVGVLIGNDQGDWALRFVENFSRANRIGGDASSIRPFLPELHEKIYLSDQQLAFPGSDVDSQLLTPKKLKALEMISTTSFNRLSPEYLSEKLRSNSQRCFSAITCYRLK